jgi:hypothetical protein
VTAKTPEASTSGIFALADGDQRFSTEGVMGRPKFVEYGSFREVLSPTPVTTSDIRIGTRIVLASVDWRIVGSAPNPHRPGDRLVFVEREASRQPSEYHFPTR